MQIKLSNCTLKEKVLTEKEKHKDAKFIEELTFTQLKKICTGKAIVI